MVYHGSTMVLFEQGDDDDDDVDYDKFCQL